MRHPEKDAVFYFEIREIDGIPSVEDFGVGNERRFPFR